METVVMHRPLQHSELKDLNNISKKIEKMTPGMILGLEFENYSDELTLLKANVNSLFKILYLYGEKEHKEIVIAEIKKKIPDSFTFSMEEREKFYESIKKMKEEESLEKCPEIKDEGKKEVCKIFVLTFLMKELKRSTGLGVIKKMKIYNEIEQEILKWAMLYLFEEEIEQMVTYNPLTMIKLFSSLLNITCVTKNYYDFKVIELTCPLFTEKNIEVFIETSNTLKITKFIKQKNIEKIENERRLNSKTIEEKLGCPNKCQNPEIMTAFKGNNSFIYEAAGNTSFEEILRVEDSIYVEDMDDDGVYEFENNRSAYSEEINGEEYLDESVVEIKEKASNELMKMPENENEEEFMNESAVYSKQASEEPSNMEESVAYDKSFDRQSSCMEESVVISHKENRSGYKVDVDEEMMEESFVKEMEFDKEKVSDDTNQRGSEESWSGKGNRLKTRESEMIELSSNFKTNHNMRVEFPEEEMKIISIKSDEIKSPRKVTKETPNKLSISNNIIIKDEVLSEDEEFFISDIDKIDCEDEEENFCRNLNFEDTMAINKPVCDLDNEECDKEFTDECNKEFIEGISVIENVNSIRNPKIGDKKFSNESTASEIIEKMTEKPLEIKKKLHFNEIPSENLIREEFILDYLNQLDKGEISFEYENEQSSECYEMQLEPVHNHQEDKIKTEFEEKIHIDIEKVLSNWMSQGKNEMNQQEIQEKKSADENGIDFVRSILVALLNEGKQEKIAQFIENIKLRVNKKNRVMIKRGENIEKFPQPISKPISKSEQTIKNVFNRKVGTHFNPERYTYDKNYWISSLNEKKETKLTSICQELKSSYLKFHKTVKSSSKSKILQLSGIDPSLKETKVRRQLQSYFSQ